MPAAFGGTEMKNEAASNETKGPGDAHRGRRQLPDPSCDPVSNSVSAGVCILIRLNSHL
jgi:hypothetical protein